MSINNNNNEIVSELEETLSTDQLDHWKGQAELFKFRYDLLTKLRNKAAGRIEREELTFENDDDDLEEPKQEAVVDTTSSTALDTTDISIASGEDPLLVTTSSNPIIPASANTQTRKACATKTAKGNNDCNGSGGESSRNLSQQESTLQFQDINVVAINKRNRFKQQPNGSGTKSPKQPQRILTGITGQVKQGNVLGIMGPHGCGKATLMNVLTFDAQTNNDNENKITGSIRLNGHNMTANLFKKHCFVVKQQDNHWPHLTARETVRCAAGLFHGATTTTYYDNDNRNNRIPSIIFAEETLKKMRLCKCADTKCVNLSKAQKLRLSIAMALLKQPAVLFLHEPTSGLDDTAAATCIMSEISRVAKEENIIALCTISSNQPLSAKVYNNGYLDQIMILSRDGRAAFQGNYRDAIPHFTEIGYPLPEQTNPAEFFLELVNDNKEVKKIVDEWESRGHKKQRKGGCSCLPSIPSGSDDHCNSNEEFKRKIAASSSNPPIHQELYYMFQRHMALILRDPILYAGRCAIFLVMNITFAFVYWNARQIELDQIHSKLWIQVWFVAAPLSMGVLAVYALNNEFKSIQYEYQNGMSRPFTYILAKSLLVLPIFFVFGIFALVIPSFVIQATPWSALLPSLILYAINMLLHEAVAEFLSIAFSDPIRGIVGYLSFGFAGFLFGGVMIPTDDLYWPFKMFSYIMPFGYYIRSIVYVTFSEIDWSNADYIAEDGVHILTTSDALEKLKNFFPVAALEDTVWKDILIMVGIAAFWKFLYIILVMTTTRKVARIKRTKPALQQVQNNGFDELQ